MAGGDLPPLTRAQKLWAFTAAALFLIAIGFLGFALNAQVMVAFAVGNGGRTSGVTRDGVDLTDEVKAVVTAAFDSFAW